MICVSIFFIVDMKRIGQWNLLIFIWKGFPEMHQTSWRASSISVDCVAANLFTFRFFLFILTFSGISKLYLFWRKKKTNLFSQVNRTRLFIAKKVRKNLKSKQKRQLVKIVISLGHQPIKSQTNRTHKRIEKKQNEEKTKIEYDTKVEPRRNAHDYVYTYGLFTFFSSSFTSWYEPKREVV